ncbi:MAG: metallophosphoesterase [Dehalococcoidia bacterium]|nr:metallophosphoesterase [Dehalococcoidia bacterium]
MRLGLISDTHMPGASLDDSRELPKQVIKALENVEMILHVGDIFAASCLDWLEKHIAPVCAVEFAGAGLIKDDPRVEEKRVLELEGHRIGMVHDFHAQGMPEEPIEGAIERYKDKGLSVRKVTEQFFGSPIDIVIFGHTHDRLMEEHDGILLVNPGSPVLPKQMRRLGTVGILEISNGSRHAEIISLKDIEI